MVIHLFLGTVVASMLPSHNHLESMYVDILVQTKGQLLGMDPPRHGPIRRAVISHFTSKMLAELEPRVRDITREIMQQAQAVEDCNFVYDLAGELPTSVIGSMLGVPRDPPSLPHVQRKYFSIDHRGLLGWIGPAYGPCVLAR